MVGRVRAKLEAGVGVLPTRDFVAAGGGSACEI